MRADLHVHSRYSGRTDLPVLRHIGQESYSEPEAVYEQARRRGMDLVTLTDHDSIEGALRIARLPGTFVSEEVTVVVPGGRHVHLGVYDITEVQHQRVAALRRDPDAFFAYLVEEQIPTCLNHPFSALTGPRQVADLELPLGRVSLIEAFNGSMPSSHNERAGRLGESTGLAPLGGSDSHTLAGVADAFTTVVGARSKQEFLDGLRRGRTVPGGKAGGYARLTAQVTRVFAAGYRDALCANASGVDDLWRVIAIVALLPLLPLIPVFTAAIYAHELRFGAVLARRLQAARRGGPASSLPPPSLPEAALRSVGMTS